MVQRVPVLCCVGGHHKGVAPSVAPSVAVLSGPAALVRLVELVPTTGTGLPSGKNQQNFKCALKESFIWVERKTYYKRM